MLSISIQNPLPLEVLKQICHAALCPDRPGNEGLKTLASFARTCRLFHEPAITTIWRDIPDILALIHTLPEDLWLETHIKAIRNDRVSRHFRTRLSFKRTPVQDDFARLKHYAHRIAHVLYANTCLIPPDVLGALAIHFPAGTLLPNMLSLTYHYLVPPPSELNHSLQVLFGPKLESIHVVGAASGRVGTEIRADAESFDCVRTLPRISPNLSSFSVGITPEPKLPLITVIPEMITAFRDLTRILVGRIALDFPAIFHLVSFRNLEVLDACVSESVTQADILSLTSTSTREQAGYFPKIKQISLDHLSLSLFTSLLKLVSSPDLEEVMISTSKASDVTCTSEDVSELVVELSRHSVLANIIIYVASPVTGAPFDNTTFTPLLSLSRICVLDVDIAHPLEICDELIASMAVAWRSLFRLSLCVAGPRSQPNPNLPAFIPMRGATLFGLVPFALFCPGLEWLGLPLDTNLWCNSSPPGRLERRPGCGAALSEMTFLDVGLSVVYDPVPVAAFLSDFFPGLEGIRTAWKGVREEDMSSNLLALWRPSDIVARWEEVADLVDEFATVRKQERICRAADGRRNGEPATEDPES